jgi:hypothetical protein
LIQRRGLLLALPALVPIGGLAFGLPPPRRVGWFRAHWVGPDGTVNWVRDFPRDPGMSSRPVPGWPSPDLSWPQSKAHMLLSGLRRTSDGRYVLADPAAFEATRRRVMRKAHPVLSLA